MPKETKEAVKWALKQKIYDEESGEEYEVTKFTVMGIVLKVREYFNINNINYDNFSYSDLEAFL